jgi:hypothetical protein
MNLKKDWFVRRRKSKESCKEDLRGRAVTSDEGNRRETGKKRSPGSKKAASEEETRYG